MPQRLPLASAGDAYVTQRLDTNLTAMDASKQWGDARELKRVLAYLPANASPSRPLKKLVFREQYWAKRRVRAF
jgi:hypothetical protein